MRMIIRGKRVVFYFGNSCSVPGCCWTNRLSISAQGRITVCGEVNWETGPQQGVLKLLPRIDLKKVPEPFKSTIVLYRQVLRHRAAGIAARKRKRRRVNG